jgi:glutathione S-transferase
MTTIKFQENFMENLPCFLLPLMVAGLRWPVEAAIMGLLWNVGRVLYALGYTRNGPANRLGDAVAAIMYRVGYTMPGARNGMGRLWGSWFNIVQVVLMVMAGRVGWDITRV